MRSTFTLLFAVSGMALLSTGCFTTRLQDARVTPGAKHDEWRSFFFWGLAGKAEVDVRELCAGEAYEVSTGTNAGTWLVSVLTLGIYSPEKVYVTCGEGKSKVAVDLDNQGRPVRVEVKERDRVLVGAPSAGAVPGSWTVALHDAAFASDEVAQ